MLMGMLFLFVLVGMFSSCTSEDENLAALNEEVAMVKTAATAKEQFRNDLQDAMANVKNGEKTNLSTSQINLLQESAIRMLKAEGVYNAECQKMEKVNKAELILVGTLYFCMTSNLKAKGRFLKTRSNESSLCIDADKAIRCFETAIGSYLMLDVIDEIVSGYKNNKCLTEGFFDKAMEKVVRKLLFRGVSLPVSAILTISTEYYKCMKS